MEERNFRLFTRDHITYTDHTRWLFETNETYGFGNAVWLREGYLRGGEYEAPPWFNKRMNRPLTREVRISVALISPYRLMVVLRLVALGLFLSWRILHPNMDVIWLWLTVVICEVTCRLYQSVAMLNHINFRPLLPNRKAMATISLAMSRAGAAVTRPSKTDPNQIQSHMPNLSHWPVHQLGVKNAFLGLSMGSSRPFGLGFSNLLLILLMLVFIIVTRKYAAEILERAHMANCNPSRTPVDTESKLGDDGDPVSDLTFYRSLAGYCVFLGNNLLLWSFKRQSTLSSSSVEAKYRGVANDVAETNWLKNLLHELHTPMSFATLVYYDNVSAGYLSSNPQHQRTKQIEIDIHFVQDLVVAGQVQALHVSSRYQYANIFTKRLPSALFEEFHTILSARSPPVQTAKEW
nr:ribonuclease H-like domain-containing protein [Tanacetum cinerariifolium]